MMRWDGLRKLKTNGWILALWLLFCAGAAQAQTPGTSPPAATAQDTLIDTTAAPPPARRQDYSAHWAQDVWAARSPAGESRLLAPAELLARGDPPLGQARGGRLRLGMAFAVGFVFG